MPASLSFVHILLLLAAAFLLGFRIFRETQPSGALGDRQSLQLQRLAKTASIGLGMMLIAVILGLDLGMFHTAKVVR